MSIIIQAGPVIFVQFNFPIQNLKSPGASGGLPLAPTKAKFLTHLGRFDAPDPMRTTCAFNVKFLI